MTLNASEPSDTRMISEIPSYVRESRAAINFLDNVYNSLSIPAATTSLSVGSDLASVTDEYLKVSALGAVAISTIIIGTAGQVKTFIFQDTNISLVDGTKDSGKLFLNQTALSTWNPAINDILSIINIGGDGSTNYGYWIELYRKVAVK